MNDEMRNALANMKFQDVMMMAMSNSQAQTVEPDNQESSPVVARRKIADVITEWENQLMLQDKSDFTVKNYLCVATVFADYLKRNHQIEILEEINHQICIEWRDYFSDVEMQKPDSINTKITTLKIFFKFAIERGYLDANPIAKLKRRKKEEMQPKSVSGNDIDLLQQAIKDNARGDIKHTHLMIVDFLIYTGIRIGELVPLKFRDVDLDQNIITVRKGKGKKQREIPISPELKASYQEYLDWLKSGRKSITASGYIFLSAYSDKFTPSGVRQFLDRYSEMAEISRITPHMLRHTFATNLVQKGAPIVNVQKLLGHSNITTTARYTQPSIDDLSKSIKLLSTN